MALEAHRPADQAEHAVSLSIAHCEHGHVFLRLHRHDGSIIAVGSLEPGLAELIGVQLRDEAKKARTAPLAGTRGVH
ncbi:MAG: hypothetical protein JWQ97_2922 [Phenylobacterium sp.]|nr:hypothetical protein [Phenylobacterium sp.]